MMRPSRRQLQVTVEQLAAHSLDLLLKPMGLLLGLVLTQRACEQPEQASQHRCHCGLDPAGFRLLIQRHHLAPDLGHRVEAAIFDAHDGLASIARARESCTGP